MRLRVTQYGEPVLKTAGAPVTEFDAKLSQLVTDMLETMHAEDGIGLAAQQIGQALQLFVADLRVSESEPDYAFTYDGKTVPLDLVMPLVAINGTAETSGEMEPYEEGCLSFPGIRGEVLRPASVTLRYQDLEGQAHTITANGLFGRVIQHEYDHTMGTLFTERMSSRTLFGIGTKLKRLRRQSRDWLKENVAS